MNISTFTLISQRCFISINFLLNAWNKWLYFIAMNMEFKIEGIHPHSEYQDLSLLLMSKTSQKLFRGGDPTEATDTPGSRKTILPCKRGSSLSWGNVEFLFLLFSRREVRGGLDRLGEQELVPIQSCTARKPNHSCALHGCGHHNFSFLYSRACSDIKYLNVPSKSRRSFQLDVILLAVLMALTKNLVNCATIINSLFI